MSSSGLINRSFFASDPADGECATIKAKIRPLESKNFGSSHTERHRERRG